MRVVLTVAAILSLVAGGCTREAPEESSTGTPTMAVLSGAVTYRERILLSADHQVTVTLADASAPEDPAAVIATTSFSAEASPPYRFSLRYDPAQRQEGARIGLSADIRLGGALKFATDRFYPAFADEQPLLVLKAASSKAGAAASALPLAGAEWTLTELDGEAAPLGAGDRPVTIAFEEDSVSGFSGCNRFAGSYSVDGGKLEFGNLAVTQMACLDGTKTEIRVLKALSSVGSAAVDGGSLRLLTESGEALLTFTR